MVKTVYNNVPNWFFGLILATVGPLGLITLTVFLILNRGFDISPLLGTVAEVVYCAVTYVMYTAYSVMGVALLKGRHEKPSFRNKIGSKPVTK